MLHKFLVGIVLLIPLSITTAQVKVIDNLTFSTTVIKKAVIERLAEEKLTKEGWYHIIGVENDSLVSFLSGIVKDALEESGYNTAITDAAQDSVDAAVIRIFDAQLSLKINRNVREITGSFTMLVYSSDRGEIRSGREINVELNGSDNVEGMRQKDLISGSPGFLVSGGRASYSGGRFEKLLAVAVAGIITYLFYSVRI
ncbi:MAG: hypothetical protein IID12_01835 [Candidatus Marinimicrobia bacterium]|nr:hypothetical protein [Candidatus Neomarinimicrobiota bacterium]